MREGKAPNKDKEGRKYKFVQMIACQLIFLYDHRDRDVLDERKRKAGEGDDGGGKDVPAECSPSHSRRYASSVAQSPLPSSNLYPHSLFLPSWQYHRKTASRLGA